jgi:hypothetical protein
VLRTQADGGGSARGRRQRMLAGGQTDLQQAAAVSLFEVWFGRSACTPGAPVDVGKGLDDERAAGS